MDVRDVGLRGHSDDEIASYAKARGLIILTADLGFGNVLRFPIGSHPGIVVARFPNETRSEQLNQALRWLSRFGLSRSRSFAATF